MHADNTGNVFIQRYFAPMMHKTLLTLISVLTLAASPAAVLAAETAAPPAAAPSTAAQPAASASDVMYVDDVIWIAFREGKGDSSPSKAALPSGTRLTVLERDAQGGYVQVRRDNGDVGWVQQRYLQDKPTAELLLTDAQKKLELATTQRAQLQAQLNELKQAQNTEKQGSTSLQQENQRLKKELDEIRTISKNEILLNHTNKQLNQQLEMRTQEMAQLEKDNTGLSARLYGFTIGAAVISLIAGLYIGTMPVRREKRWRMLPS